MKVTIERETLQAAIDALKRDAYGENNSSFRVIDALRAALAQPAEPPTSQRDIEYNAFDSWLARVCPSGDVEDVHRQWLASSDYEDCQPAPAAAPPGYRLVPIEPTEAMGYAADATLINGGMARGSGPYRVWQAMIAAAPSAGGAACAK